MNYYIITYGCQMNKSDSERIAALLEKFGYKPAFKENEADLIVVNMCSVRQAAVDRVYGKLEEFKKIKSRNKKIKTILTGCVLKKDKEKFKNGFDLVLDIKDLPRWKKYIKPSAQFHKLNFKNNFSASIPVSNGCDNFCTYCVVPFTRGPLVCRDYKEILKEAKRAVRAGVKEVWLLGQNVNRYRSEPGINFAKLLEMVQNIPGDFWVRFTSPNPADFSDELIATIAKCEKITPYLNLPVQSGDDEVLRRMNRRYTIKKYKNLVKKIRAAFEKYRRGQEKEFALSTDVIVGYPGETKQQFENTLSLFKKIKFDMAYVARYSQRAGTAASRIKDNVSQKEKQRRWKVLTLLLEKTALKKNEKFIGKTVDVLIEKQKKGFFFGKSRHYKTVKIPSQSVNLIGQIVKVKIREALPWGLKGEID